ncbi:MAG TPA: sodium:calcium antiporter [Clostridia bacterium]|nr:sodium:calcium antiporter [Clostridia bacterium]
MTEIMLAYLHNLSTWALVVIIVVSLYVLSKGADLLVDEAVNLSLLWGIPKTIIGATIVSLGTTLPETSVSVMAAIHGSADLALGNAIGSIIVNTGLIIGLTAVVGRLLIDQKAVKRQGEIQVATALLVTILSLPFLSPEPGGKVSQAAGFFFLFLLLLYVFLSLRWSREDGVCLSGTETGCTDRTWRSSLGATVKMALGILLVVASSRTLVPAVELTAIRVGIPQSIIAATLIAFGTSVPELVTAITSVRKGHGELAIGNVTGANILNVLLVIGGAAAVSGNGLAVPANYYQLQFPTLIIILLLFRHFTRQGREVVTKAQGLTLLLVFSAYFALNYFWI